MKRLWIDVTSTARSPQTTGISRMTRGLFCHLSRRRELHPISWEPRLGHYARLTPLEQLHLLHPERASPSWLRHLPGLRPLLRSLNYHWHRFQPVSLSDEDWLLLPEVFEDNRTNLFSEPQRKGPRRIAIFHDDHILRYGTPAQATTFRAYLRALSTCQAILCISEWSCQALSREFQRAGWCLPALRTLPWPVPFDGPRPAPPLPGKTHALFLSTLERRKNLTPVLEAWHRLICRGIHLPLTVVGAVRDSAGQSWLKQMQRWQSQGLPIRATGAIDDARLEALWCKTNFTLYPSLEEGFGLPVLESLWRGIPCLCGNGGGMNEVTRHGGCLLLDVTSVPAWEDALRALLEPSTWQQYHRQAASRTFRRWEDYVGELLDWLEAIT